MKYFTLISDKLKEVLVFDIETSSHKNGKPINIKKDFEEYIQNAVVKWVGFYSYKYDEYYEFNALTQGDDIKKLISEHNVLVGFNNESFDYPIMVNNGFISKHIKNLDIMLILGDNKYLSGYKKRAMFMGVKLKPIKINGKKFGANSLQGMASAFNLKVMKGDIDYTIFYKNVWDDSEIEEIKKYLRGDVRITKELFDKTVSFWSLFTDWLDEKYVSNWKWITSTIASLTYISVCCLKGVEPTFSNNVKVVEEMGGRAVMPCQEEVFGMHYLDEVSKYPHIFSEFNLFNEVDVSGRPEWKIKKLVEQGKLFHGNEKFKVKGYYDIRKHGVVEQDIINKLKTRFVIKKILKDYKKGVRKLKFVPDNLKNVVHNEFLDDEVIETLNGLQYAIKIYANSLYGAVRSNTFEQISTPNAGYDCCWIGQQIHKYVQDFFESKGFKIVGGFTDSWFIEDDLNGEKVSKDFVMSLARECFDNLKKFFPFPEETHQIGYECYVDYLLYNFDKKKKEYKKNNYVFISDGKVKIVGFPIIKSNASKLGKFIFKKYLENEGLKKGVLKFDKEYIEFLIKQELERDISLAAVNYKCNVFSLYKNMSQLQAQISRAYLGGDSGSVDVIKNKKFGKVGIGNKYCSVKEALDNNLNFEDLILDKVWNELSPFITVKKSLGLDSWGL